MYTIKLAVTWLNGSECELNLGALFPKASGINLIIGLCNLTVT